MVNRYAVCDSILDFFISTRAIAGKPINSVTAIKPKQVKGDPVFISARPAFVPIVREVRDVWSESE